MRAAEDVLACLALELASRVGGQTRCRTKRDELGGRVLAISDEFLEDAGDQSGRFDEVEPEPACETALRERNPTLLSRMRASSRGRRCIGVDKWRFAKERERSCGLD